MSLNFFPIFNSGGIWKINWKNFIGLFCLFPTLIYTLYLVTFASPQYTSEFRIQIKSPNAMQSLSIGALLGVAAGSSSSSEAGYAVTQYLDSPAAWTDLEKRIKVRERYAMPNIDWFHRLNAHAPIEEKVKYWRKRLDARFETTSQTVTVRVEAFSPEDARIISRAIFQLSEELLNNMSLRARTDQVRHAQAEVSEAQKHVEEIESRLLAERRNSGVIDPAKQVTLDLSRIADLQRAVDEAELEVTTWQQYLAPNAPAMAAAKAKLAAAKEKLALVQASKLQGTREGGKALPPTIKTFSELEISRDYAMKRFEAAMAALNSAQMDAERQQLYFDTIVQPQLPQERSYPALTTNIPTFFVVSLAICLLILFLAEITLDHTKL
ncbi:MAG: hypothetical protein J7485_05465 [Sphingobium sp.]|nr:hypothetical protein [Sphingobium sp.]